MSASGLSYIGGYASRQLRPLLPVIAVLSLSLSLAACGGMGLPFEAASEAAAQPPGKSLVSSQLNQIVNMSDWEIIRRTVADDATGPEGSTRPWTNARTGSSGTVTTIAAATPNCRGFQTTINDLRGIRGYRGEACRVEGGWQLQGVVPDDSVLL